MFKKIKKISMLLSLLVFQVIGASFLAGAVYAAPTYSVEDDPSSFISGVNYKIIETADDGSTAEFRAFALVGEPPGFYFRSGTAAPYRVIYNVQDGSGTLLNGVTGNSVEDFDTFASNNPASVNEIAINNSESFEETADEQLAEGTGGDDVDIGCAGNSGAFGWIMCPAIEGTLGFINFMSSLIASYLQVPPIQFTSDSPQYQIWQTFRDLALGLMMIAMLVMVFGQALSLNIDAYTVKKILPRIVIATIGVMLSIYLIAFVVDFFNILGNGVADLVKAPLDDLDIAVGGFPQQAIALVGLFAGGAIVFSMGIAGFMLLILIPVALAFLTVYLTLVVRQVVIVMLIIIAPVALVLWTIPGTEKYAKTWWSVLFKALLMYPLIMLLLAAGQVFAVIITNTSSGGWLATLTALVAIAVPMFLVPATFRMAGGAIGMASNAMNNMRSNIGKRYQDPSDSLGRNLKASKAMHDQKRDANRTIKAQGLHYKSNQGFRNKFRAIQRAGAAGTLMATGAGRGALAKNYYAAIGKTEEEMNAQALRNPYAFQDYVRHGSDKESLRERVAQLRSKGNNAQADQVERLAGSFGYGNQAAAGAMLLSLGKSGKLSDDDIYGAGSFFGGNVEGNAATKDSSGRAISPDTRKLRFAESQKTAAATFGGLVTDAGFAATGAPIGQWEYRNAAVVSASSLGDSGGGFIYDRHGNEAVSNPSYTTQSEADWVIASKIPSVGRITPDTVKTLGPSVVDHINSNPRGAQEQALIKGAASAINGFGYSTPETINALESEWADKFEGAATPTQIQQHEDAVKLVESAKIRLNVEQQKAAQTGGPTPELAQATAGLQNAQASLAGGPIIKSIAGEQVIEGSARHVFLKELTRNQQVITQAGP